MLVLRWALDPWLGDAIPLVTLYGGVAIAVWYAGYRPALLSAIFGFLGADYFFTAPRLQFGPFHGHFWVALFAYAISSGAIIGFGEAMQRARQRLRKSEQHLANRTLELQQANENLHAASERLSEAQRIAGVGSWENDLQQEQGIWSDECFRILGYISRSFEPSFRYFQERVHPDDMAKVLDSVEMTRPGHERIDVEFRIITPDGEERLLHSLGKVVFDDNGRALRVVGTVQDVTERKRVETERQMFVSLAEQSTEFIGICDMNFMPFFVNAAGLQLVGLDSLEQAKHTPVKEFFFPEDQRFIYEKFFPQVLSEGRAEVEIRLRHFKTGQPLWVLYNVFHVHDPDGNSIGLATVSRDITERKKMEQMLLNSQTDLNRAQTVGQIGSWRLNVKRNELTWSAENHRIFGIPEKTTLTYETFLSAVHPDDREYVDQMWRAALWSEPYDIEHRVIVDGKMKWVREKAELEFDKAGEVLGGFGTTQDITERKQAEEALLEADHRKNEFLAILAHELRNPLTPICNAAAILRLPDAPESTRQNAQDLIDRQLQHMVRLIDDLMDVSRITRGKLQLRKERIDLLAVLQQALEAARSHVEEAKHVLTVSLPTQPIYLDADPVRLTQVFLNLLNNACKYTEQGGSIRLDAEREGSDVVVKVTDTGTGISPEFLPNVFELFSQIPSAVKQSDGGIGIGLSLARNLVEMHGGSIEATSDGFGKGSKFIVRLPALDETTASPSEPPQDDEELKSEALRVLVADDNRDVSESLVMLLEVCGHEVATAFDGQQAIEATAQFRPDVVLLDISMPKLDGHDACRSIRQQPWGKDIKIFALTGLGGDDVLHKSRESGFTGHLVKPIDSAVLLRLLTEDESAMP